MKLWRLANESLRTAFGSGRKRPLRYRESAPGLMTLRMDTSCHQKGRLENAKVILAVVKDQGSGLLCFHRRRIAAKRKTEKHSFQIRTGSFCCLHCPREIFSRGSLTQTESNISSNRKETVIKE
jgi:hypothetical protein